MTSEVDYKFLALNARLDQERAERKKWHDERLHYTIIFGVIGVIIALMKQPK